MVEKLKGYLEQLVGKAVVVDYVGFVSGLKCFDCMEYWEDEKYIILSEQDTEDYIWIKKRDIENIDILMGCVIESNDMIVNIGMA